MQGAQPTIAVGRVNCFIGPIEVHVVFARLVPDFFENGSSLRFTADVFRLEKIKHSQAVNGFSPFRTLIDIRSEGHFCRIKSPCSQAILAHSAVTGLVVRPPRGVMDPFPRKYLGKLAQNNTAVFNSPDLVQMTYRGTQL